MLGWGTSFLGIVVPLFILLLNSSSELTIAKEKLIDSIIHRINYNDDSEKFYDVFLYWREQRILTKEQYQKYILWLRDKVDQRIEAIVGGGYRKSYYKAAMLAAALGEVLESNGMENGKILTIENYKKKYPRKSAFKAELKIFG